MTNFGPIREVHKLLVALGFSSDEADSALLASINELHEEATGAQDISQASWQYLSRVIASRSVGPDASCAAVETLSDHYYTLIVNVLRSADKALEVETPPNLSNEPETINRDTSLSLGGALADRESVSWGLTHRSLNLRPIPEVLALCPDANFFLVRCRTIDVVPSMLRLAGLKRDIDRVVGEAELSLMKSTIQLADKHGLIGIRARLKHEANQSPLCIASSLVAKLLIKRRRELMDNEIAIRMHDGFATLEFSGRPLVSDFALVPGAELEIAVSRGGLRELGILGPALAFEEIAAAYGRHTLAL